MENSPKTELSCMTYLIHCGLVATGHEDGAIRLWNLEIGTHVLLTCEASQRHTNTISCIKGIMWKGSEFLIAGSFDGHVSVWEIN